MTDIIASLMRDLPYSKTDSVADLDAPRKSKLAAQKKPRPTVPARRCDASRFCSLREHGHCDDLHCKYAADYNAQRLVAGLPDGPIRGPVRMRAAMIPSHMNHLWEGDTPNHAATERLIRNAVGNRVVMANCPKCGGTGITPNKERRAR